MSCSKNTFLDYMELACPKRLLADHCSRAQREEISLAFLSFCLRETPQITRGTELGTLISGPSRMGFLNSRIEDALVKMSHSEWNTQ